MTCSLRSARLLDRGIIQADPFTIHVQDSFKNLSEFLSSPLLAKDIQDEAKWLLSNSVQIVYLDAPFGPILAAKEAGIPSVIVSNFTFDSIYTGLLTSSDSQTDSNTRDMIASVTSMYSQADACIRLPGYIPIPSFTTKSDNFVSVSLVARKAKRSKNDVRRELGLKLDTLVLLVTLGGFDLAGDDLKAWARSSLPPGWKVIVACPHSIEQDDERMRVVKSEEWYIPGMSLTCFIVR